MKSQSAVIDNFKKVCICRSITGGTIMKAIRGGCLSFEALRRKIRVGTGSCNAKRCRENIETRIKNYKASQSAPEAESEKETLPR